MGYATADLSREISSHAGLFLHYDIDISSLIRFLGSNYTAAYRHNNVNNVVKILRNHNIDDHLTNISISGWCLLVA